MKKSKKILIWSLLICLLLGAAGWGGWSWYDNNIDRSGWREADGVTMYADFHGKPIAGWLEIDGSRYYFDEACAMQTGWLTIDGSTYYLDDRGRMATSWLDTGEGRYFLDDDGIVQTGWQTIEENSYFFAEDGRMQTGWLEQEFGTYYLKENGIPTTGWLDLAENRYYFGHSGQMYTGRQEVNGKLYCFDESGAMQTGWLEEGGGRAYCHEDGAAAFGWTEIEGNRYYFNEEGMLCTGWMVIDENRYFFDENGLMHTGWLQQGEYLYYFHADGTIAQGPTEIDGEIHYFTPLGIRVLLVNRKNPISADYAIDLVEMENGWMVDRQALEPLKAMFQAMRDAGLLPYFSSTYRDLATQQAVWNNYMKRYMDQGYDEAQAKNMTASYVAIPGTSEHHTGLAMDIVGHDYFYSGHPGSTMAVQAWLAEHCWEYGFILRYTAEKSSITGFAPETWHFRYVGTLVSMDMKDSGLCLEEYLGAVNSQ